MEQVSSQGSVLQICDRSGQLGLQGSATGLQTGRWVPQGGDIGAERESDLPKIIQAVDGKGGHPPLFAWAPDWEYGMGAYMES